MDRIRRRRQVAGRQDLSNLGQCYIWLFACLEDLLDALALYEDRTHHELVLTSSLQASGGIGFQQHARQTEYKII